MHVILLASDEEKKLQPLTDTLPAAMLPIANRPVMAHTVELLARAGLKHILVSLYQKAGTIMSYFSSGSRWGTQIEYMIQPEDWGSAGALKWAEPRLNETFLVLPAAALLDLDIAAALEYHRTRQSMATLILHPARAASAPALVQVDADGRISLPGSLDNGSLLTHTGAYIFEPQVLSQIPVRTAYDCFSQLIPALLTAGVAVNGYVMPGYYNKLDTLQAYQDAQSVVLTSAAYARQPDAAALPNGTLLRYPSIEGRQIAPGIWAGRNHFIHPSARLIPPLCIGNNCRIGRNVEIGPATVLGEHVVIDDEATVHTSTILEQTYVGRLVDLTNRIVNQTTIIDPETGVSVEVVDAFLLTTAVPAGSRGARFQRSLDLIGALLLLCVNLPLLLLISLLVYVASGGQVVRRFRCTGRRPGSVKTNQGTALQTFELLAFQTARKDGTTSRVGRWLMRWELDRLPELFNVLRGDLALVGVKPLRLEETAQIQEEWYQKRYECPSGLTGLWYIQTDPGCDLEEILLADTYFAATRTRRTEIMLFLRTPLAWVRRQIRRSARERRQKTNADPSQPSDQPMIV